MYVLRRSGWEFVTSGSGGVSIDILAIEGGVVDLRDTASVVQRFRFGGVGAGLSTPGIRVPRLGSSLGRLLSHRAVNGSGSITTLYNQGGVYKTGLMGERELTRGDIAGACMIVELGVSTPSRAARPPSC